MFLHFHHHHHRRDATFNFWIHRHNRQSAIAKRIANGYNLLQLNEKCHKKLCNWWFFLCRSSVWFDSFCVFLFGWLCGVYRLTGPLFDFIKTINDNILRNAIKILKVIHQLYWRHSINGGGEIELNYILALNKESSVAQCFEHLVHIVQHGKKNVHFFPLNMKLIESKKYIIKVVCLDIDTFFSLHSIQFNNLSKSIDLRDVLVESIEANEKVLWKHCPFKQLYWFNARKSIYNRYHFVSLRLFLLFSFVFKCFKLLDYYLYVHLTGKMGVLPMNSINVLSINDGFNENAFLSGSFDIFKSILLSIMMMIMRPWIQVLGHSRSHTCQANVWIVVELSLAMLSMKNVYTLSNY